MIMRTYWNTSYHGNIKNFGRDTTSFIRKYAHVLQIAKEVHVGPITMEEIREACMWASKSASGPDGFEPAEMRLMSDSLFQTMADLLDFDRGGSRLACRNESGESCLFGKGCRQPGRSTEVPVACAATSLVSKVGSYQIGGNA